MKIVRIEIVNILGTRHAEFQPGTLTVIRGQNGSGKSSVLGALRRCFEGGHDPGLLKRGAKFGEVILELDNGAIAKLRVTPKQTTLEVTDADGREIKAPRTFMAELGDSMSVDPTRLLTAADKDVAKVLLDAMLVEFSADELQACFPSLPVPVEETPGEVRMEDQPIYTQNAPLDLEGHAKLYALIEEQRKDVNRAIRDAEGLERNLRQGLKEVDAEDWAARVKDLRSAVAEATAAAMAATEAITKAEQADLEELRQEYQRLVASVKAGASQKRDTARNTHAPEIARIHAAIGEAEEKQRNRDRMEGLRQQFEHTKAVNKKNATLSDAYSTALDALKELRAGRLKSGPIPGLEVIEGVAYYDSVPWQRVNTAKKVEILLQIGAMRAGKLPFMIVDNVELMDAETFEQFKAGALPSGFQVVCARVSDGPLAIETEEAPKS